MGYLTPPPSPAPVIVHKDVGGLVTDYQAQTEIYRREGREVRLHECRSACTLALSLPNVCVYPDAQVKFHLAYNAVNRETDAGVSSELFSSYPAAVQARLGYLTRQYKVLSGTELIALGIRNCNGSDRTLIASARTKRGVPPAAGGDPLGDLAQGVQSAVAKAFGGPDGAPQAPIRVAVVDRKAVSQAAAPPDMTATGTIRPVVSPQAFALPPRMPGDVRVEAAIGEAPLPPRRPPSLAFTEDDAIPPHARLMPGAQPILASYRFAPIRRGESEN